MDIELNSVASRSHRAGYQKLSGDDPMSSTRLASSSRPYLKKGKQKAAGNRYGEDEDIPEDEVDLLRDERDPQGFAVDEDEAERGVELPAPREMAPSRRPVCHCALGNGTCVIYRIILASSATKFQHWQRQVADHTV
jgi:hypothetical protein